MAKLPWTHGLAGVNTRTLAHPRSHGAVLGLITRVLGTTEPPHALLVLVGMGGLPRGRVGVSGRVGHVGIALRLWVSYLGSSHPNMAQVVRGVLSRGVRHALRRVVLVQTCWVGGGCLALHATIVALRHLVARHLGGASPRLRRGLLVRRSALLRPPDAACTCSSPGIPRVPVVGARVGRSSVVVGGHAVHVDARRPLTWTVLAHHSSRGSSGLVVTSVRTVVVDLAQFRLPCARPSVVHHPLVVTMAPLVLVV